MRHQQQTACVTARRTAWSLTGPDGFLRDPSDWSLEVADELARAHDVGPLTLEHWRVIEFTRAYYLVNKVGPAAVRIVRAVGLSSRRLWELFPDGVIRGVYRVAGLPRPHLYGCACS